jgi:hypothetical protein
VALNKVKKNAGCSEKNSSGVALQDVSDITLVRTDILFIEF